MPATQRIVQVCLFIVAAIALFGGTLQMSLGQPETIPRLDNVHSFMGGTYLSMGIISFWAAMTIRQHRTLIYLMAFGVLMAGIGRLISHAASPTQRCRPTLPRLSLGSRCKWPLAGGHPRPARLAYAFNCRFGSTSSWRSACTLKHRCPRSA